MIFGHIRAASDSVHDPEHNPLSISYENCHPFKFGRWTFMHNGMIPEFQKIRLLILNLVSPDIYVRMSGSTDSEHVFALFLHLLGKERRQSDYEISAADLTQTIEATISTVLHLMSYSGIASMSSLNMAFTNGTHVVATRFRGNLEATEEPPSLYYCMGEEFDEQMGHFRCPSEVDDASTEADEGEGADSGSSSWDTRARITEDLPVARTNSWKDACAATPPSPPCCSPATKSLVVSSAPLGREDSTTDKNWTLIPRSCMLVCKGDYGDVGVVESVTMKCIHVCPQNAKLHAVVRSYYDSVRGELSCTDLYAPVWNALKQPNRHNVTDSNHKWGKTRSDSGEGDNTSTNSPVCNRRGFVSADGCYVSKSCCDFLLLESECREAVTSTACQKAGVRGALQKITNHSISQVIAAASESAGAESVSVLMTETETETEPEQQGRASNNEGYRMVSPRVVVSNNTPFSTADKERKKSPPPPPSPASVSGEPSQPAEAVRFTGAQPGAAMRELPVQVGGLCRSGSGAAAANFVFPHSVSCADLAGGGSEHDMLTGAREADHPGPSKLSSDLSMRLRACLFDGVLFLLVVVYLVILVPDLPSMDI